MTNEQLYLAIGLPIIINALFNGMLFFMLNHRINDMRDLLEAKLGRVEEIMGARLKHLEEIR